MILLFLLMGVGLVLSGLWMFYIIMRQFQAKSNFYIGSMASASRQAIVHSVIGFQQCQLLFTYLGCLIFKGCLKIYLFDDMVRKVLDKIFSWANRLLSFIGKLVLIRHMLSSMPLHCFMFFGLLWLWFNVQSDYSLGFYGAILMGGVKSIGVDG